MKSVAFQLSCSNRQAFAFRVVNSRELVSCWPRSWVWTCCTWSS